MQPGKDKRCQRRGYAALVQGDQAHRRVGRGSVALRRGRTTADAAATGRQDDRPGRGRGHRSKRPAAASELVESAGGPGRTSNSSRATITRPSPTTRPPLQAAGEQSSARAASSWWTSLSACIATTRPRRRCGPWTTWCSVPPRSGKWVGWTSTWAFDSMISTGVLERMRSLAADSVDYRDYLEAGPGLRGRRPTGRGRAVAAQGSRPEAGGAGTLDNARPGAGPQGSGTGEGGHR